MAAAEGQGQHMLHQVLVEVQEVASVQRKMQEEMSRLVQCLRCSTSSSACNGIAALGPQVSPRGSLQRSDQGLFAEGMHRDNPALQQYNSEDGLAEGSTCAELPPEWPATITGRMWAQRKGVSTRGVAKRLRDTYSLSHDSHMLRMASLTSRMHRHRHLSLDPNARPLAVIEFLCCLVLCYDLFMTPYTVAWNLRLEGATLIMSWSAASFWTVELFLSFFVGYYRRGELVFQQPEVALHYLRRSFAFDFSILLVDWTNLLFDYFIPLDASGRTVVRYLKFTRLLKALRVNLLVKEVGRLNSLVLTENSRLVATTLQVIGVTLLMTHFLACIWVLIGREANADTGIRWLEIHRTLTDVPLEDTAHQYQYTSALHWTIAQLTLGANEIFPVNSMERVYTMMLLIVGLLYGSSLVSFFASRLMHFIILRQDQSVMMAKMKQYLRQHRVSKKLARQICSQVLDRTNSKPRPLQEHEVAAFALLSQSLQSELYRETRMPTLMTHALFRTWEDLSAEGVTAYCTEWVSFMFLAPSDDLFFPLSRSQYAYCVSSGKLVYSQSPTSSKVQVDATQDVGDTCWIAEATLWTEWLHVGHMTSLTSSRLVKLNADGIEQLLGRYRVLEDLTCQYCLAFHQRLMQAEPPHADYPNDLHVPFAEPSELLSAHVGLGMIWKAVKMGNLNMEADDLRRLEDEVRDERCFIDCSECGSLTRTVFPIILRLESSFDDCIFTELGVIEGGKLSVRPRLPGTKRSRRELPKVALERYLSKELPEFAGSVHFQDMKSREEQTESLRYGISTRYHTSEFRMTTSLSAGDVGWPLMPIDDMTVSATLKPSAWGNPKASKVMGHKVGTEWVDIYGLKIYSLYNTGSKCGLYAWLTPDQLKVVQMADNAAAVEGWVASYQLPFEAPEALPMVSEQGSPGPPTVWACEV